MTTIELNDPFTGEWTVFKEATLEYDEFTPITSIDDILYKESNGNYFRRVLIDDTVNVKWFGALGNDFNDDSEAIMKASKAKKNIYFPKGKYKFNAEISYKGKFFGTNSKETILKPYNPDEPVIILNENKADFWQYATVFEGLTFEGSNKRGCGISLGKATSDEYEYEDEFNTNITFRNIDIKGFNKGIQCLFGNIGMDFYSVGIHGNKYGMYFLDNKFGTPQQIMHAGNKYFYSGEVSGNEVGIYIHNTTDGFGGVTFNNVIFELNHINTYIYSTNSYIPVTFNSCWNEGSGKVLNSANKISIDTWNSSIKGEKEIDAHAHIFEGKGFSCNVYNSWVSDYYINGDYITVKAIDCSVESDSGVGATPSIVTGNNSYLLLHRPITTFGIPKGDNIFVVDSYNYNRQLYINNSSYGAATRSAIGTPRFNKIENIKNKILSLSLESSDILTGSLSTPISGALINDAPIFNYSNQFIIPFNGKNQYMNLAGSTVNTTTSSGEWYVITFDVKINSGDPTLFLWNRNQYQIMQYTPTVKNKWQTVISYAETNPNDSNLEFFLDISAESNVDIQLSAYQVLQFSNQIEAKAFMESKVFAL